LRHRGAKRPRHREAPRRCRRGASVVRRGRARPTGTSSRHQSRWLTADPIASVDLTVPAFPVRLVQLELLHLAGRRSWDRVDEGDRGRSLVACEAVLAKRDQRLLVNRLTGLRDDDGLDSLAPLLVRYADDGDLRD